MYSQLLITQTFKGNEKGLSNGSLEVWVIWIWKQSRKTPGRDLRSERVDGVIYLTLKPEQPPNTIKPIFKQYPASPCSEWPAVKVLSSFPLISVIFTSIKQWWSPFIESQWPACIVCFPLVLNGHLWQIHSNKLRIIL